MQTLVSQHQFARHAPVSTPQPWNVYRQLLPSRSIRQITKTRGSLAEASVAAGQHGDEPLRTLIARYDSDGDGRLTLQEVEQVLNTYKVGGAVVKTAFV